MSGVMMFSLHACMFVVLTFLRLSLHGKALVGDVNLQLLALQAVENIYGTGGLWGFLQMPFGDFGPQDVPWPNVPIQISKQYYAMMQACSSSPDLAFCISMLTYTPLCPTSHCVCHLLIRTANAALLCCSSNKLCIVLNDVY